MRWKSIPGFSCYAVSENGIIKQTSDPKGRSQRGVRNHTGSVLAITQGKIYKSCGLYTDAGKFKTVTVHVLVALAFLNKPNGAHLVRHRDGNPLNNHFSNLCWGTDQQNSVDMMLHGRCKNQYGSPVFSDNEVRQIRKYFLKKRMSKVALAKELGVNYWTLRDMLNGKNYGWVQ